LLVVGLILGTTLTTSDPGFRDTTRESHRDITPARQFKVTLAKAVRQLVGGDQHKPVLVERGPVVAAANQTVSVPASAPHAPGPQGAGRGVRVEHLDLPPPASLL
jgi:hypothetical protein